MKIALISDIHGNLPALEAVLADIARREADITVNLGDSIYGPLWPRETAEILIDNNVPGVAGNEDLELISQGASNATMAANRKCLTPRIREWLHALPLVKTLAGITCFHGTPGDPQRYLLEEVRNGRMELRDEGQLQNVLKEIPTGIAACGHSHLERVIWIAGKLVINAGSVGCPAYRDDSPFHKSESGSPFAKYVLLDGISAEIIYLEYDFRTAAARASANGRPDWEHALLSGRAL